MCIQGTHSQQDDVFMRVRFIPVYTGNTCEILCRDAETSVYPCVYREHNCAGRVAPAVRGLSLCIQGTLK